jgi:hypothetical protein
VMIWAQMADDKMELGMERELKFKYDDWVWTMHALL